MVTEISNSHFSRRNYSGNSYGEMAQNIAEQVAILNANKLKGQIATV
jgi:hypothetical protein